MVEEYIINSLTLYIERVDNFSSKVFEKDFSFIINRNINEIIADSCIYYGCTFDGRVNASKLILGTNIKLPIVIEESQNIIFFPTRSNVNESCVWVSFNNLENIDRIGMNTKIIFKNGYEYVSKCSFNVIDRQFYNCLKLERLLLSRRSKI